MHRMTRRKGLADTVIIVTSVLFRARAGENVMEEKNCYSNYIVAHNNNDVAAVCPAAGARARASDVYTQGKKMHTHTVI